jgi:hypothetical protein
MPSTSELLLAADRRRPRAQQAEIGMSELGDCRRRAGYRLAGTAPSNPGGSVQAAMGSAIHDTIARILEDLGIDGVSHEAAVRFAGIPGHYDRVENETIIDVKGLALTTQIPTPSGWTTMGAVKVGDEVFSSDGLPCRVMVKSATKRIGTYIVRFRDGATVVCDREHLWWAMRIGSGSKRMEVVGVEAMADSVKVGKAARQANWRVPVAEPLVLPQLTLPVPPYVLGCWLGDGSLGCGRISKHAELFAEIEREGFEVGPIPPSQLDKKAPSRTVHGLAPMLRGAGVLHNRYIPHPYLRASLTQRQALIQGLMDSDGTWNKARHRAEFSSTSKALAEGMYELLISVGEQPHMAWGTSHGFGVQVESCRVDWSPLRFNPFRTPVKASRVEVSELQKERARFRTISSIECGPDVETACIAVGSANRTYLCGAEMVPTHNTTGSRWLEHIKLTGPEISHIWQVSMYGAALITSGQKIRRIRIDYLARDTGEEYQWPSAEGAPFSPMHVRDALGWLQAVKDAPLAMLPRDHEPDSAFCRGCPFFGTCWEGHVPGRDPRSVLFVEDPDAGKWAGELWDLRRQIKTLQGRERRVKAALDAVRPDGGGFVQTGGHVIEFRRTARDAETFAVYFRPAQDGDSDE